MKPGPEPEAPVRFQHLSPAQAAAIGGVLGPGPDGAGGGQKWVATGVVWMRVAPEAKAQASWLERKAKEIAAQHVWRTLTLLRSEPRTMKAPMAVVFDYLVLEKLSQRQAAKRCRCSHGLIAARVKTIEARFSMTIEKLVNHGSDILERGRTVKGDRQRRRNEGDQGSGEDAAGSGSDEEGEADDDSEQDES